MTIYEDYLKEKQKQQQNKKPTTPPKRQLADPMTIARRAYKGAKKNVSNTLKAASPIVKNVYDSTPLGLINKAAQSAAKEAVRVAKNLSTSPEEYRKQQGIKPGESYIRGKSRNIYENLTAPGYTPMQRVKNLGDDLKSGATDFGAGFQRSIASTTQIPSNAYHYIASKKATTDAEKQKHIKTMQDNKDFLNRHYKSNGNVMSGLGYMGGEMATLAASGGMAGISATGKAAEEATKLGVKKALKEGAKQAIASSAKANGKQYTAKQLSNLAGVKATAQMGNLSKWGAKHPGISGIPRQMAENAVFGAGTYGLKKATGEDTNLAKEMAFAQAAGLGIHGALHGVVKPVFNSAPVQNAIQSVKNNIAVNPTKSNWLASINNFLNLDQGIKEVGQLQKIKSSLASNPGLNYQQVEMINRLNNLSPADLADFQRLVRDGVDPSSILTANPESLSRLRAFESATRDANLSSPLFADNSGQPIIHNMDFNSNVVKPNDVKPTIEDYNYIVKELKDAGYSDVEIANVIDSAGIAEPVVEQPQIDEAFEDALAEKYFGKPITESKLDKIEQAIDNGTPVTKEAIYGENTGYTMNKPQYSPNPVDDINLFEQARDYNVPQNNIGYTPEVVQPRVSIPKVKPNTKKTLAEWKSKYSTKDTPQDVNRPVESQEGINTHEDIKTPQNEPSGHTLFVDRTYSKEELRNLPLEELNAVRAQASRTLKMDATDYNNAYGKPYTKQALKRVKQTFDNAEAVYKEKYNPEVQRNTMENEGGNYDDNWKPTLITKSGWREVKNPDGTIHFRYRRKSKSPESPKLGSTNEIKPSKVSHSENYDTSTTEYKGIENTEGYKVTKLEPGKAEGSEYKPQRNTTGEEPNYYEGVEEGRYTEKELRDAYKEDIKENLELDNADIENRQKFFDKERMEEYGENYNGKEETGTVYDEKYERGEYGEAENVAENEAEIFKNASEEFKQFWKEYKDLPKKEKANYLRQYVKDMSFKNRKKFQNELTQQEDFLARKYSPKKAGDEYTDEYDYYNKGSDTQTLANATKSHSNNRAEQVYGDSLEVRENANIKRISSEKQHSKSIDEANRFMAGKRWGNPSSNSAVTSMQGRFNINHGEAQKVYDRTLSAIKGSKLDMAGREHALKVLNKAAENFNNLHPNKAIDIKLDADIKPTSAETLLENANKSGDLSAGYNVLKYNKKLKSTDLGEEHYRQSQDKMLNETLPKLKEELSDLENDLARATDPAQKELLQYKIDKKKIEMHEQAMERGQQGINYYRNFVKDKAEMSSYNRETGEYEKKGVSWDRHSEGLRQPEYEAIKNELESYSLRDYELENAKQRVADYEHKNRIIEFDENISDEDFVELATKNPSAIRKHMDSLPEDKQQKVVATVYNKALTTGKGLAIVRGKSTTIGQVAESGNKAFKEVLEQHPELKDVKVSTKQTGRSNIDIDTNEIIFSEPGLKEDTLPHEIQHLKDNQSKKGHALLIDLANKKQAATDYINNANNKPTIIKAINLIGEKEFSSNAQLYSYLRKNGFTPGEMNIIKGYKKLDSEIEHHLMEKRGVLAERGENVANIDKELAEMEKTNQIRYRQLQRTIESVEGENTGNRSFGTRRSSYVSENKRGQRRLVAQEDSFTNNLKSIKKKSVKEFVQDVLGHKELPWKQKGKPVNKEVRDIYEYFYKVSKEGTEKAVNYDIDLTADQAVNRQKLKSGEEGLAVYFPRRGEGNTSNGIDITRDYAEEYLHKVGLYGAATKNTPQAVTARDGMNLITMNNKRDLAINIAEQVKNYEHVYRIPDIKGYDYHNLIKPGYVPANSSLMATALFGNKSKAFVDTLMKGEVAIKKAFPEAEANHWINYMRRHSRPDIQIPKVLHDQLYSGFGEDAKQYTLRYCQPGQIHGDLGSWHTVLKYARAVNKVYLDLFKRNVLTSNSFVINNRIGNWSLLMMSSDNPKELSDAVALAKKLKDADLPPELIGGNVAEALGNSKGHKRLTITGDTEVDNMLNALYGNEVDLSKITETIKKKGIITSSNNSLHQETKHFGDVEVPNPDYKKQMRKGKLYNAIAKYEKQVNKIRDAYANFNEKGKFTLKDDAESGTLGEIFERKVAYARELNKVRAKLIEDTGNKFITQLELLEHVKKHPEIEESIVKSVCDTLGDYNSFSRFEQEVLKQIFPFYSWTRTISRHIVKNGMKYPSRYALFALEYNRFMENEKLRRKSWQKGIMPLPGRKDPRSGEDLGINLIDSTANPFRLELPNAHPFVQKGKFLLTGEHDIGSVSSRKYSKVGFGENEHYEDRKGRKYKNLPVSARVNSILMDLARDILFTNNRAVNFEQLIQTAATGQVPDKQFEDSFFGYRNGDKFNKNANRYSYNANSRAVKYINWATGNKVQSIKPFNKEEKKRNEEWREKHRK